MDIINLSDMNLGPGLQTALTIMGVLIGIIGFVSLIVNCWLTIQYSRFNRKENSVGLTGEEIARKILDDHGLQNIKVNVTGSILFGNSYSHHFKKVRLRRWIRHEASVTALGMGAQKACLAILDKEGDPDMKKRVRLYPFIAFGPFAFIPMLLVGVVLDFLVFHQSGICTYVLGGLGLLFYFYSIVLSVLTLITEKNAQNRAYAILQRNHLANEEELEDLKALFRLYNIQYINDIILASLELIYTLLQIVLAFNNSDSAD